MRRLIKILFITGLQLSLCWAQGPSSASETAEMYLQHPEVKRAEGFSEYLLQRQQRQSEEERGLRLHLETLEIQARDYEKARKEYRDLKRLELPLEKTPAYREHVDNRDEQEMERLQSQNQQRQIKVEEKRLLNRIQLDAMKELDLPETRPRYDYKKRSIYGGEPKFKRSQDFNMGGGGYTPPPPSTNSPGSDPFPPPPAFDDFPPPPTFPEDNFDIPPPPPAMPYDGDMPPPMPGAGDEFFPPPPPPPPFEDNFNF